MLLCYQYQNRSDKTTFPTAAYLTAFHRLQALRFLADQRREHVTFAAPSHGISLWRSAALRRCAEATVISTLERDLLEATATAAIDKRASQRQFGPAAIVRASVGGWFCARTLPRRGCLLTNV